MTKRSPALHLKHVFVESAPDELEEGTLYVSLEYASVIHQCCCGCGREVVTPLSPTDWCLEFDGVSVSLWPSIGNWTFPCRSHYWIEKSRVYWASDWSEERIAKGRTAEAQAKARYYEFRGGERASGHDSDTRGSEEAGTGGSEEEDVDLERRGR